MLGVPSNPYAKSALVADDAVPVTLPVRAPTKVVAVIIPAAANIPEEFIVTAVPTTAVVNIPLLTFAVATFIVTMFALVIEPNPILAVSDIAIAVAAIPV